MIDAGFYALMLGSFLLPVLILGLVVFTDRTRRIIFIAQGLALCIGVFLVLSIGSGKEYIDCIRSFLLVFERYLRPIMGEGTWYSFAVSFPYAIHSMLVSGLFAFFFVRRELFGHGEPLDPADD